MADLTITMAQSRPVNITLQKADFSAYGSVTDTASLDLTLSSGVLSGVVLPAGVDHDSLQNVHQDVNTTASPTFVEATAHSPIVSVTDVSKTLALSDKDTIQEMNNGSAQTLNIPLNSAVDFDVGVRIDGYQFGAGTVTIQAPVGVSLNGTDNGSVATSAQYSGFTLIQRADDDWVVFGGVA